MKFQYRRKNILDYSILKSSLDFDLKKLLLEDK